MKSAPTNMEWITEFLNSEKTLFFFAGIIGIISVVVGSLFLLFSNHKSFAISMLVLGIVEMGMMFPTYLKYHQKIDRNISMYDANGVLYNGKHFHPKSFTIFLLA